MPQSSLKGGHVDRSFHRMSPVRRQPSLPSKDTKELPPLPKFSKLTLFSYSTTAPTVNYIKRISFFILLEGGFIILAAVSFAKPIVIGFPDSLDQGKGAFTVLFIIWQTIAILPLQHIVLCTFSHEWSLLWEQSQLPFEDSNRIDQVSVLTSDTLTRIRYLVRGESSKGFKLALVTSLTLLGLLKLGPGAVGVATVRRSRSVPVIMGKLTLTGQAPQQSRLLILQRAQMIAWLEQFGNSLYGLNVQTNHIVGWTTEAVKNNKIDLTFPSDVISFDYSCHWEVPGLSEDGGVLNGGGARWTLGEQNTRNFPDGDILAATPVGETALSAYLFYGSNSTYGATNSSRYALDMGDIPSLVNPTGFRDPRLPVEFDAPLLSMLICDPQMQISGGRVHLLQNGSALVESGGFPSVGNIPQPAANFLFSQGLLAAFQQSDRAAQPPPLYTNQFYSRIFLQHNPGGPTTTHTLLDLNSIAKNVNAFLLSASKAFSDGYSPTLDNPATNIFATIPVQGTFQEEIIALTASGTFLIITIVLSLAAVILVTGLYLNVPESLQLFNLRTIMQYLEGSIPIPGRKIESPNGTSADKPDVPTHLNPLMDISYLK